MPNEPNQNAPRVPNRENPLSSYGKVSIQQGIAILNQASNRPAEAPIDVNAVFNTHMNPRS